MICQSHATTSRDKMCRKRYRETYLDASALRKMPKASSGELVCIHANVEQEMGCSQAAPREHDTEVRSYTQDDHDSLLKTAESVL